MVTRRATGTTEHFTGANGAASPQVSVGTANITIQAGDTAVLVAAVYAAQASAGTTQSSTVTCGGIAMTSVPLTKVAGSGGTDQDGWTEYFQLLDPVTAIGSTGTKTIVLTTTFTTDPGGVRIIIIPTVLIGALDTTTPFTGGHATSANLVASMSTGAQTPADYLQAVCANGTTAPTATGAGNTNVVSVTGSAFTGSDNASVGERTTAGTLTFTTDASDKSQLSYVLVNAPVAPPPGYTGAGFVRQEDGSTIFLEDTGPLVLEAGTQGSYIGSGNVLTEAGDSVLKEDGTSKLLFEALDHTALTQEQGSYVLTEAGDHLILESLTQPWVTQVATAALTVSASPSLTFATVPKANDIVIMWPSTLLSSPVIQAVAGWVNPLGGTTIVASDAHAMACVYHVVTAGEESGSTVTFTATSLFTGTQSGDVVGCVIRGANSSAPIDGAGTASDIASTATPHILAAVTPTLAGGLVLSSVAKDDSTPVGSYTTPFGWNRLVAAGVSQARWLGAAVAPTVASTTVGPTNITPSAADEYVSITIGVASASGVPTLAVQGATHGHVADNVVLTQVHNLTVASATHAHTAGNVALVVNLVVANATHSHIAGAPVLVAIPAVQSATHAHTAQNVALVKNLVVQSATHAHTAANVPLGIPLIVASATHAHTAGAPVLVASPAVQSATHAHTATTVQLIVNLAVNNATHAHSAPNVPLGVPIAVQNASHGHTAGSPTLVAIPAVQNASHGHTATTVALVVNLVVANSTHSHTATNVSLAGAANLVVANTSHGHTAGNVSLVVNLVVQGATHAHSAANVALGVPLIVASATHSHTAQNVVLVKNLAVQSATHSHVATNVAVGVPLIVASATHGHTAGNVALGVGGSVASASHVVTSTNVALNIPLIVASATHAHVVGNVTLALPVNLVVQGATHGHTATSVKLVVNLVVANATHGHTASNVVLGLVSGLGVQDATHGHTATNVPITGVHVLAIQSGSHAHSASIVTLVTVTLLAVASAIHAHLATNITVVPGGTPLKNVFYLNLDTGDVYQQHTTGEWDLQGTIPDWVPVP